MSDIVLKVGKYAGTPVYRLPAEYMAWLINSVKNLNADTCRALLDELAHRSKYGAPSLGEADRKRGRTALLADELERWRKRQKVKNHPDRRGGSTEASHAVDQAADDLEASLRSTGLLS